MNKLILGKKYILPIIIAIVIAVSWFGVLDEYSDNYTDDSILQAGVSYAIARGINGIVSVLQTSTVQAGVGLSGSIAFGEVLDPINDLIERFSDVMSLALGSLVLQKILLGISAHSLFKLLIAGFGLTLITSLLIKNAAVTSWALRIFVILIFIRFSLVIVVSINSIADNLFITTQITNGNEELNEFRDDVVKLKNNSGNLEIDIPAHDEIIRVNRLKIDEINTTVIPNIQQEMNVATSKLKREEGKLEDIQGRMGWLEKSNPFNENKAAIEEDQKISNLNEQIDKMHSDIKENNTLVEQLRTEIEVSEKRIAGVPVGLMENITNVLPTINGLKRSLSLDVIEENITDTVRNVIQLSVLYILKTILIPLAFFYFFIKGVKGIWKMELTRITANEMKLSTN